MGLGQRLTEDRGEIRAEDNEDRDGMRAEIELVQMWLEGRGGIRAEVELGQSGIRTEAD